MKFFYFQKGKWNGRTELGRVGQFMFIAKFCLQQLQMSDYPPSGFNGGGVQMPKTFVPYNPVTKTYQPYIPSAVPINPPPNLIKQNDSKTQQNKSTKYNSNLLVPPTTAFSPFNPKQQASSFKPIPTFLENRSGMKGSMIAGDGEMMGKQLKMEGSQGQLNTSSNEINPNLKKPVLMPDPAMKFSAMEFGSEGLKVPSFIQDKNKQRKIPSLNGSERAESSKQITPKTAPDSLASSYGNLKKMKSLQEKNNQLQVKDPAAQWIKKSWSKKKDKPFTINDFEQIKELGTGKYGKVFLARQKQTNFICALKILQKQLIRQQQITQQIIRELKIQSFLNHTNLIKMYGFFDDASNIYLIMEAATGGQLFKQLKKHQSMPQAKVAGIMRQVCQAISQLHSNRIIHRDIKPQNIVIHDGVIKLCDFGWSVYCDSNLRTTFCGTPLYVGPQILKGKQYDEKIDIWSLGVMMYEMLVGENPFKIVKEEDLIKIIKDEIKIPAYVEISAEGKDFLFACLEKNPDNRMSIRELMNHDFFKKYPDKNDKKLGI